MMPARIPDTVAVAANHDGTFSACCDLCSYRGQPRSWGLAAAAARQHAGALQHKQAARRAARRRSS